jgi:hypothetical protein
MPTSHQSLTHHKEHIMSTTHKLEKKLVVASALAATLPALLFVGAGTAQAKCYVQGKQCVGVAWDPWDPVAGVTVHITNNTNNNFPHCTYAATPDPNQPLQGLPTYTSPPFALPEYGTYNLAIPTAFQTGTKWNVSVDCGNNWVEDGLQHTF